MSARRCRPRCQVRSTNGRALSSPVPPPIGAPATARTVIAIWLPPAPASESTSDKVTSGHGEIFGDAGVVARVEIAVRRSRRHADSRDRVVGAAIGLRSAAKQSLRAKVDRERDEQSWWDRDRARDWETVSEREWERGKETRRKISARFAPFESNVIPTDFARQVKRSSRRIAARFTAWRRCRVRCSRARENAAFRGFSSGASRIRADCRVRLVRCVRARDRKEGKREDTIASSAARHRWHLATVCVRAYVCAGSRAHGWYVLRGARDNERGSTSEQRRERWMSGKLRESARERERERESERAKDGRGTAHAGCMTTFRCGEATLPEFPPPSRTPLLHAATIRRREGEEGGGHESDRDDDGDDGGEYTAFAVVLVTAGSLVVVVRDRVAPTRI